VKWYENNKSNADLKAMLDDKVQTGGIGFRGEIRKSVIVKDISKVKLKLGKKRGGAGGR